MESNMMNGSFGNERRISVAPTGLFNHGGATCLGLSPQATLGRRSAAECWLSPQATLERRSAATDGLRLWLICDAATRLTLNVGPWLTTVAASLLLLLPTPTHAIGEFLPVGGRSAGMGDAYTALADGAEGLFWNPAAVATSGINAVAGYDLPFQIADLETAMGSAAIGIGRFGVGVTHHGSRIGTSQSGLLVGMRVKDIGAGVRIRQIQHRVDETRSRQWVVWDLGVLVGGDGIYVGMVGFNAGGKRTGILGHGGAVGLAVTRAATTVTIDVQKEAGTPTGGGVGLELDVHPSVKFRLGIGGYPERITLGLGVLRAGAVIDYGISYHTVLGSSHRASIGFRRRSP